MIAGTDCGGFFIQEYFYEEQQCHSADSDCDGRIETYEMLRFIEEWLSGIGVSIKSVLEVILMWRGY